MPFERTSCAHMQPPPVEIYVHAENDSKLVIKQTVRSTWIISSLAPNNNSYSVRNCIRINIDAWSRKSFNNNKNSNVYSVSDEAREQCAVDIRAL